MGEVISYAAAHEFRLAAHHIEEGLRALACAIEKFAETRPLIVRKDDDKEKE